MFNVTEYIFDGAEFGNLKIFSNFSSFSMQVPDIFPKDKILNEKFPKISNSKVFSLKKSRMDIRPGASDRTQSDNIWLDHVSVWSCILSHALHLTTRNLETVTARQTAPVCTGLNCHKLFSRFQQNFLPDFHNYFNSLHNFRKIFYKNSFLFRHTTTTTFFILVKSRDIIFTKLINFLKNLTEFHKHFPYVF